MRSHIIIVQGRFSLKPFTVFLETLMVFQIHENQKGFLLNLSTFSAYMGLVWSVFCSNSQTFFSSISVLLSTFSCSTASSRSNVFLRQDEKFKFMQVVGKHYYGIAEKVFDQVLPRGTLYRQHLTNEIPMKLLTREQWREYNNVTNCLICVKAFMSVDKNTRTQLELPLAYYFFFNIEIIHSC